MIRKNRETTPFVAIVGHRKLRRVVPCIAAVWHDPLRPTRPRSVPGADHPKTPGHYFGRLVAPQGNRGVYEADGCDKRKIQARISGTIEGEEEQQVH